MMRRFPILATLFLTAFSASSVHADLLMFELAWSGAQFGNSAAATATITIDDTVLPNPGITPDPVSLATVGITSFTMTVSGASSGNGTFTTSNFVFAVWDSGNFGTGTLDLGMELVGQPFGEAQADIDQNGFVNLLDVNPFVVLLSGG